MVRVHLSPPVSQERYKRQMFIENRIEKKKRTDSCIEKDQRKTIKGLSESGNTLQDRCPTRKRWVVENSVGNEVSKETVFSNTTQNKQLFAKLKQEANLKSLKFQKRKRERSKRSCSSEKEHKVNALAPRAEEGRDYLRKVAVSRK